MVDVLSSSEAADRIWDVVVIGSGIAGITAAIRAAQHGLDVLLVDQFGLGGVSLNKGGIAARFVEKAVEVYEEAGIAGLFGIIDFETLRISMAGLQQRKKMVLSHVVKWFADTVLPSYGVSVVFGRARLVQPHGVKIAGEEIAARYIVVATGASTPIPETPGLYEAVEKGYAVPLEDSLSLEEIPESILIYGGGLMAIEVASIWTRLGSRVVVANPDRRILREIPDEEIVSRLGEELKRRGVKIHNATSLAKVDWATKTVFLSGGEKIEVEKVVIAHKRKPNTEDMGLEKLGVEYDENGIKTDDRMRTTSPHIYAAGDVVGNYMYANSARLEGQVAADNIAGYEARIRYDYLPIVGYTEPEIASVGIASSPKNPNYIIGRIPVSVNFYAYSSWRPYGVAKIVAEKETHRVRGFHMVGFHAAEAANTASIAIMKNARLEELAMLAPAHPTITEIVVEAAHAALGSTIYLPRRIGL